MSCLLHSRLNSPELLPGDGEQGEAEFSLSRESKSDFCPLLLLEWEEVVDAAADMGRGLPWPLDMAKSETTLLGGLMTSMD